MSYNYYMLKNHQEPDRDTRDARAYQDSNQVLILEPIRLERSQVVGNKKFLSRIIPCDYQGCHRELTRQWSDPGVEPHYTDPKTCDLHTHDDLIIQRSKTPWYSGENGQILREEMENESR